MQAIFAVVKATNGASRLSAYMLRDAILKFYTNNHLFPAGLCADAECTQTWALKHGNALKRLVALLIDIVGRTRRICKRAKTSKDRKLNPLRNRIATLGIASLVCKDKGDKDHDDEDSNDGVPAAPAPGIRMLSFETLSLASGSSSGSSTSGTLSSGGLSVRDSEVSRLASQLQGLRLLSKGSPGPSVGSTVTTTASLFDFAGKADSEPAQPAHIPSGNKPEKILPSRVFADLATWLPEPSKGFPLSSQYAGAFDAEDVDGIHEPPEDHEPKPKKAGNKKATKPKSKAGSKKAGPKSKAGSKETGPESKAGSQETEPETEELDPDLYDQYVPNLYGEKRLTYIATHAPQHGNKEAANMWNSSLQKARMLAGVSLRELKKRKFVPKEATENPFVKIVKQAKLAAVGGA
ncbi:unnamed protein product [Symbiodinium sp. CCMP2592]|nr:unnamed protein product [Symbiodinium sp. CCMP2592]